MVPKLIVLTLTCLLCLSFSWNDATHHVVRSQMLAVTSEGDLLLVINPDSNSVSVMDLPAFDNIEEISVGKTPQSIALDASNRFAYVTLLEEDRLLVLNIDGRRVSRYLPVADEPMGVIVDTNGRVFVASAGANLIQVFDASTWEPISEIQTESAPTGLALSESGKYLYTTHFFSGLLSVIDLNRFEIEAVIPTSPDSNLSHSLFITPNRGYLPQTRSNATNRALLFDTTVFPVVSVVDLENRINLRQKRISLDVADRVVGIPIDAVVVNRTNELYVLNAGSNDVSVIDLTTGMASAHLEVGANPRGLALTPDERTLYVNNTLDGTVSVINTITRRVIGTHSVTDIPLTNDVLNGKRLFNSSVSIELSKDRWISCATCHFNGEHDGRTWFFQDGPRNTPSLLGVADTGPFHWSGDLDELHDVESTIRNIQAGTGLIDGPANCTPACDQGSPNAGRSEALDHLVAYLETLTLSPNPNLIGEGELPEIARRGKDIFFSAQTGCASCHLPPLYTDRMRHDVGTGTSSLENKGHRFDTPSLRGIYKTAPYLHDGSAATLMDVLINNANDEHGTTSHLFAEDLEALVEFLKALPYEQ